MEILSHPAGQAGLTHCGWGGTTEFIMAGVPMVTFPHFGDQPMNSTMLIESGAGIEICAYPGESEMKHDGSRSLLARFPN